MMEILEANSIAYKYAYIRNTTITGDDILTFDDGKHVIQWVGNVTVLDLHGNK